MSCWGIREKHSQRLMPDVRGVGRTRVNFGDYGPPRLFTTIGGAKTALRMWCQGIWSSSRNYEDGHYYLDLPEPTGKQARNPDLYEVVRIELFVHSI